MGRAQKNTRRGKQPTASAERKPTPTNEGNGNGVAKRTGTERPQSYTHFPTDLADPVARVIKSRN